MLICGLDEVGRGAWAGPLAVGAVVLEMENSENPPEDFSFCHSETRGRPRWLRRRLAAAKSSISSDIQNPKNLTINPPDFGRNPVAKNPAELWHQTLRDSKTLSKLQREKLARNTKLHAVAIGVGWCDARTIDQLGLSHALKLAAQQAFQQIPPEIREKIDKIIIDGTINLLENLTKNPPDSRKDSAKTPPISPLKIKENSEKNSSENTKNLALKTYENILQIPRAKIIILPKADAKIAAVSAAATVAKVARDHYMAQLERIFPEYDFAHHVGYGTAEHLAKLCEFGAISGVHRQSFAPIKRFCAQINSPVSPPETSSAPAKPKQNLGRLSRTSGYVAENVAADFLISRGHKIIVRNWKTKFCEIDIISARDQVLFFTEVKYRENLAHGTGLDAITPRKLAQMKKSAEIFLAKYDMFASDFDVQISALSLHKHPPEVDEYLENAL